MFIFDRVIGGIAVQTHNVHVCSFWDDLTREIRAQAIDKSNTPRTRVRSVRAYASAHALGGFLHASTAPRSKRHAMENTPVRDVRCKYGGWGLSFGLTDWSATHSQSNAVQYAVRMQCASTTARY